MLLLFFSFLGMGGVWSMLASGLSKHICVQRTEQDEVEWRFATERCGYPRA